MKMKMVHIDNRMVVDSEWEALEAHMVPLDELKGAGYTELGTGTFVPEEKAYDYALERLADDGNLKDAFVEWFYSDNWIKEA